MTQTAPKLVCTELRPFSAFLFKGSLILKTDRCSTLNSMFTSLGCIHCLFSLHWCSIGSKLHTGANVSTFEATCALGAPAISMFSHLSTTLTSSYSSVLYWIFHTLLYVYSATDVTIVPLSYIYISLLLLRSVVSSALLIGYVNDIIFVIVLANWKWKGFRRHQRNRWCMDQCVLCL